MRGRASRTHLDICQDLARETNVSRRREGRPSGNMSLYRWLRLFSLGLGSATDINANYARSALPEPRSFVN